MTKSTTIAELIFDILELERDRWQKAGLAFDAPFDERVTPDFWTGPASDDSAPWRVRTKTVNHDLAIEAPDLGQIHPSILEYLNSCWFLHLHGVVEDVMLELEAVPPGMELFRFLRSARAYKESHDNQLDFVPIGLATEEALQIVIDNKDGSVYLDDWEKGQRRWLADGLVDLLTKMCQRAD